MILAALLAAGAIQAAPTPREPTDAEACQLLRQLVAGTQAELPMMVDSSTRLDGDSVICSLRTFANNKFVLAPVSSMREGWEARKQQQWNEIICRNEAFLPLARRGWRFVQNLTFQDGTRRIIDAHC